MTTILGRSTDRPAREKPIADRIAQLPLMDRRRLAAFIVGAKPEKGHYAIGLRDGGSEWHVGRERRDCSDCSTLDAARTDYEARITALEGELDGARRWVALIVAAAGGEVHVTDKALAEDTPTLVKSYEPSSFRTTFRALLATPPTARRVALTDIPIEPEPGWNGRPSAALREQPEGDSMTDPAAKTSALSAEELADAMRAHHDSHTGDHRGPLNWHACSPRCAREIVDAIRRNRGLDA